MKRRKSDCLSINKTSLHLPPVWSRDLLLTQASHGPTTQPHYLTNLPKRPPKLYTTRITKFDRSLRFDQVLFVYQLSRPSRIRRSRAMFPGLPTDTNRGPSLLIAEWLTLALALIAVGLRLHGRCISLNIPSWDDHTILAATVGLNEKIVKQVFSADVDSRRLELHKPPSASSRSTIDSGSMQQLWLLRKSQRPSCGRPSTGCFRSSGHCWSEFRLVSWFSECHRLDRRSSCMLEQSTCS